MPYSMVVVPSVFPVSNQSSLESVSLTPPVIKREFLGCLKRVE
jgi:hypothetical protein